MKSCVLLVNMCTYALNDILNMNTLSSYVPVENTCNYKKRNNKIERLSSTHMHSTQNLIWVFTNKQNDHLYNIFTCSMGIHKPTYLYFSVDCIVCKYEPNIYSLIFCENSFFWIVDGYLRLVLTVESMWLRAVFLEYFLLLNYSYVYGVVINIRIYFARTFATAIW